MKPMYRISSPFPSAMLLDEFVLTFDKLKIECPTIFNPNSKEESSNTHYGVNEDEVVFLWNNDNEYFVAVRDGYESIYVTDITREDVIRICRKLGDILLVMILEREEKTSPKIDLIEEILK